MNFILKSLDGKKQNLKYVLNYSKPLEEKRKKLIKSIEILNMKREFIIKLFKEFQTNKVINAAVRKIITYQFWMFLEMVLLPQLDKKAYNKA